MCVGNFAVGGEPNIHRRTATRLRCLQPYSYEVTMPTAVQLRGYDAYSRTRNFLTRLRDTVLMRSDNFTFNGLSGHRE